MWYTQFWKTIGTQDCSQGQANLPWPGNFSCPFGGIPRPVSNAVSSGHDDVIKWKHLPRYCTNGQWRVALMFSLICVCINAWVNIREAGDLRRYHAHDDVTVMQCVNLFDWNLEWGLPGWGGWVPICNMRQSACRCKTLTMVFFQIRWSYILKISRIFVITECIWVRSRNCGCLVTWFCYQMIAKPGNKTAAVPGPDPYNICPWCCPNICQSALVKSIATFVTLRS